MMNGRNSELNQNDETTMTRTAQQYLTFQLAGECYGVAILKVQEIRGWETVREIPNTPDYIRGALNLRGSVVPIIDLRARFGMPLVEYSPLTVVIVLCLKDDNGERHTMGIVADEVSDVLDVNPQEIRSAPNLGTQIDMRYMQGMHVRGDTMTMLLDVDKLLNPNEFEAVAGTV